MKRPTMALLTSGGDAPGMNAAITAVVKTAASLEWDVLGVEDGYDGLIDGRLRPLRPADVDFLPFSASVQTLIPSTPADG